MNATRPVVFVVVGTIAFVLVAYVVTLSIATLYNMSPDPKVLEYLQAAGIFAAGSLASLLAQTRGTNSGDIPPPVPPPLAPFRSEALRAPAPVEVTVVNPPEAPANVTEQPKP